MVKFHDGAIERFWAKVQKSGEDDCWEWLAGKGGGYGRMGNVFGLGDFMQAHRVSWIIHNGEIPQSSSYHGTVVRHKCDNRGCVNPNHLELGEQRDNVADAVERGRMNVSGIVGRKGFSHPRSVMTPERIALVFEMLRNGKSGVQIAQELGVSRDTIKRIRAGKTYAADQETADRLRAETAGRKGRTKGLPASNRKVSTEQVDLIRSSNLSASKLAAQLGIHQTTVSKIRRGASYKSSP